MPQSACPYKFKYYPSACPRETLPCMVMSLAARIEEITRHVAMTSCGLTNIGMSGEARKQAFASIAFGHQV